MKVLKAGNERAALEVALYYEVDGILLTSDFGFESLARCHDLEP